MGQCCAAPDFDHTYDEDVGPNGPRHVYADNDIIERPKESDLKHGDEIPRPEITRGELVTGAS